MGTARPTWRIVDPSALVECRWEDDHVLYNCASGDTHLLNTIAAQALQFLADAPADAPALAGRLAAVHAGSADHAFDVEIERLLARLDELGLIEPVRP